MINRLIPLSLLAALIAPGGAGAVELRYLVPLADTEWRLTESGPLRCRLEHAIPRFGRAVFTREAGRELAMHLETGYRFARGTEVELRSEIVSWKTGVEREVMARYQTDGRASMFDISREQAERVMLDLYHGLQPAFVFRDQLPLIAVLSTVRYRDAERAFKACVAGLYDTHFGDVRLSHIHFDSDHEFASPGDEERSFRRMLAYLEVDDSIAEIVVAGHADRSGPSCYNDGLSERRAWYVYDLLVARGVDPGMLRVDYYGEDRPLAKGSTDTAKARNRRVTVELRRKSTRQP